MTKQLSVPIISARRRTVAQRFSGSVSKLCENNDDIGSGNKHDEFQKNRKRSQHSSASSNLKEFDLQEKFRLKLNQRRV